MQYSLKPLVQVLAQLLGPEGCPWDRAQDHFSLRACLIEETYEVLEAIKTEDGENLKEELGDLLLQVVFHALLAEEAGEFDLEEVIAGITAKMVRRHPHVFGEAKVRDVADVLQNWAEIKKEERGQTASKGVMETVQWGLPALLLAEEVQKKARQIGFDWADWRGPLAKVKEELQELEEVLLTPEKEKMELEEELGDLLFAVVNLARLLHLSPEVALSGTIQKFLRRFAFMTQEIEARGEVGATLDLQYLDKIWEKAKLKGL